MVRSLLRDSRFRLGSWPAIPQAGGHGASVFAAAMGNSVLGDRVRVLLAAEQPNLEASIVDALTSTFPDCQVTVAAGAADIASAVASNGLSLAVIGYRLDWAKGLQVVREVRQHRPEVPVVMVTAYGSEDIAAEAFRSGVTDYLPARQLERLGDIATGLVHRAASSSAATAPLSGESDSSRELCIASVTETARAILRESDFGRAARLVLEACKEVVGATAGYIGLLSTDDHVLDVLCYDEDSYACRLSGSATGDLQIPVCETHQEAYRQGRAVYSNDVRRAAWRDPSSEMVGIEQVLCVPLIYEGNVVGFMELANSPRGFSDSDALIATLFGELAVISLERVRLGTTLLRSEMQFSHFAQSSPGGIVVTDTTGRIVEWNRAEEMITGIPASQVIGLPIWDDAVFLVPPEQQDGVYREAFIRQMQTCLATGEMPKEHERGEYAIIRPDGTERRIRYTLFPIPVGSAHAIGSITYDITDELEARQQIESLADALQRERDILHVTMENTRAHLAYLDPDFRFVNVNAAYVESSGYSTDELIGSNHFELYPDAENQAIFEQVRDSGESFSIRAKPFAYPNQPERGITYWDWSLTPIQAPDGTTSGLVLSLTDVTEHERATQETAQHLEQTRQLVEVAQEMLAERTLEGLFTYVVAAARRLTNAKVGYGIHGHQREDYLVVTSDSDGSRSLLMDWPASLRTAWAEFTANPATSLGLGDREVRECIARYGPTQVSQEDEAWLGVRLVGHFGHTCALIFVSAERRSDFGSASSAALSQLAGLASLGLQHIEAHAETSRRVAELNATISAIADGVIIYGPSGDIVRMNDVAQRMMTYSDVDVVQSRAPDTLGRPLSDRTVPGHITRLRNPDTNDVIWVSASAAPIWSGEQSQTGTIEILTDVTELRMYEDRLEKANAQLQRQAEELGRKASELAGRNRELRLLDAVGRDLSGTLDLDEVLERVLDAVQQAVVLGVAAVWLVDKDDPGQLIRYAMLGDEVDRVPGRLQIWGPEGVLGPAADAGQGSAKLVPRYRVTSAYGGVPQTVVVLPLHPRGELIGIIEVRDDQGFRFDPQVTALLATMATWAAIAIENALLHREAQRAAVASERTRLAGELHDAVSQLLFSAKVTAESLNRLWGINPEAVRQGLVQLQLLTEGALAEMRTLLLELRPSALIETDIDDLLHQLVRAMSARSKLSIALDLEGSEHLPGDVKIALYRIAQEALNNVMKHARATHAGVVLKRDAGGAELTIWDDGRGFDTSDVPATSLGLKILRERAAEISATVAVTSVVNEGTRICARWSEARGSDRFDRQEGED